MLKLCLLPCFSTAETTKPVRQLFFFLLFLVRYVLNFRQKALGFLEELQHPRDFSQLQKEWLHQIPWVLVVCLPGTECASGLWSDTESGVKTLLRHPFPKHSKRYKWVLGSNWWVWRAWVRFCCTPPPCRNEERGDKNCVLFAPLPPLFVFWIKWSFWNSIVGCNIL